MTSNLNIQMNSIRHNQEFCHRQDINQVGIKRIYLNISVSCRIVGLKCWRSRSNPARCRKFFLFLILSLFNSNSFSIFTDKIVFKNETFFWGCLLTTQSFSLLENVILIYDRFFIQQILLLLADFKHSNSHIQSLVSR